MTFLCDRCRSIPYHFLHFSNKGGRDAKRSAEAPDFKDQSFISHQPSPGHLTRAALRGCELCSLIVAAHGALSCSGRGLSYIASGPIQLGRGSLFDTEMITVFADDKEFARLSVSLVLDQWTADGSFRLTHDVARTWITHCDNHHGTCQPAENEKIFLPSRLLELVDGESLVKIRSAGELMTNKTPETIRYAALSYCWGRCMPEHVKTTTQNLAQRSTEGLPLDELPCTIKDACAFARSLGLRFIWIDVLCIKQDCEVDWQLESSKMALVYSSAYITLAASAAPHVDSGLPSYRFSNTVEPRNNIILHFDIDSGDSVGEEDEFALSRRRGRVCVGIRTWSRLEDTMREEPLQSRGWALQERHLSRRIVYFLRDNLFWQCRCGTASSRLPWDPWSPLMGFNRRLLDDKATLREHIDNGGWQLLVYEYCQRALTFEKDKFSAIAGIAEAVAAVLVDDQYLAGIWRSTLPVSLCWNGPVRTHPVGPPSGRAPSWSWAALDGPIYIGAEPFGARKIYCELLGAGATEIRDSAVGLRYEGWLQLRGPVKRATLFAPADLYHTGEHVVQGQLYNAVVYEDTGGRCFGAVNLDFPQGGQLRDEVVCLPVVRDGRDFGGRIERKLPAQMLPPRDVSTNPPAWEK